MAKTWNRLKSYEGADDPEIEGFIDKASRGSVGQEAELTVQLEALEAELSDVRRRLDERDEISEAFEDVARHLADVDIDEIWQEASERERWALASDLIDEVSIYPDHLEVQVSGAPRINVTLREVGLTGGSGIYGVGERTRTSTPC